MNVRERMKAFQPKGSEPSPAPVPRQTAAKPKMLRQISKAKKNDPELFKEPAQLIFTNKQTGRLQCDEKTLKLLSEISQPMSVVGITGLFRTGKSYLLNRLVGEKTGFETGRQINACTKGIWVWCRHHPYDENQVLLLLDVEGFGDIEKVNRREDTSLFTLATLLSSTLVYNNKGTLDAYALDRLNFLEEIDSTIQVSQNEEDKRLLDFDFFFPYFVVTLRDFGLDIVTKSGEPITPDEYLEGLLVQKRGEGHDIDKYNRIRLLIRRYFKKRKCFVFIQPCGPKATLEKLSDKEIEPDFLASVEEFSEYIFNREPLQLKSCRKINGRMLANLALHYVSAISQNKQPSILEATRYMVQIENQKSVVTASELYKKRMQDFIAKMGDVIPTDDSLVDFHEKCLEEALEYFKQVVIFDDEDVFQRKAMTACKGLLNQFKRICDENTRKACADALARLNRRIEKKLKTGAYSCKSGYDEYFTDINWIARKYTGITGLRENARAMLQTFLDGKEQEEELVYQLVLKAQTGEGDEKAINEALRQQVKREGLNKAITRSPSLQQDLKEKVEKMELKMNKDLEQQCKDEKTKIQENYIENLGLKIKELERQKVETQGYGVGPKEIEEQIGYFQKVLDYAKTLKQEKQESMESKDNISSDKEEEEKEEEGESQARTVELGDRPSTMGASRENIYEERPKEGRPGKKSWCRVQ